MTQYKTVKDLDLKGQRVLVRVDYNVPLKDGKVTDATRIEKSAATISYLAERGAKVILLSHLGRPDGAVKNEFSLSPLVGTVSAALGGKPVQFLSASPDSIETKQLPDGTVTMLENIRFYPGEEKNDPAFAKQLAKLGDIYVNDAFSAAHRAHASTEGIARLLPSAAGLLMQEELTALEKTLEKPQRPAMAVVGGSKVSTKAGVLLHLLSKLDVLAVGGGMANTFLAALGYDIGKSLCDKESIGTAKEILEAAKKQGKEILLPIDAIVASEVKPGIQTEIASVSAIPADKMILDIGPATAVKIAQKLASVRTVLWNGPLGVFEVPPFDAGTVAIAREIARLTKAGKILSVAGGGDTVAALEAAGVTGDLSYVSTAGGAFLEWLEGKQLPGVAALQARG